MEENERKEIKMFHLIGLGLDHYARIKCKFRFSNIIFYHEGVDTLT